MSQPLLHSPEAETSESFYAILGVSETADLDTIRAAYESLIYDIRAESLAGYSLVPPEETELEIQRISHAYMQLANPSSRKAHDRLLERLRSQAPPTSEERPPASPPTNKVIYLRPQETPVPLETAPASAPETPESKMQSLEEVQSSLASMRRSQLISIRQKNQVSQENVQQFLSALGEARVFNGNVLSQIRRLREVSLEELSEVTFVRVQMLTAIEQERFGDFAAEVYLKGYLQSYARALDLPVTEVTEDYLKQYRQEAGKG